MRHIFDQYGHPENRLTHALVSCLREDSTLLCQFVNWATGEPPPTPRLEIVEQTCPGEQEPQDESEAATRRGLPDGWVYDLDIGWGLIIESKIESALTRSTQTPPLYRGRTWLHQHPPPCLGDGAVDQRASGRPARDGQEVVGSVRLAAATERSGMGAPIVVLHRSSRGQTGSKRLPERRNPHRVCWHTVRKNEPYTYLNAKRLLRLAMDELRKREDAARVRYEPRGKGP